jgi:predicted  nucleic acid-binding Zn-ribbon protein
MKVLDILKEFRALEELMNEIDLETGEYLNNENDIQEYIVNLKLSKEDKLNNIQDLKIEFEAKIEAVKSKIEYLNNRKKYFERNINNLTNLQLMLLNNQKLETNEYSFSFRKSESVSINDILSDSKDERFNRTTIKVEPDKTAIKKAIKDGIVVDGASIETKMNLQVK